MSRGFNIKKVIWFIITIQIFISVTTSYSQEIDSIEVRFKGDDLYVRTSFRPGERFIEEARNGIRKELKILIDLFRVWENWPDEYIYGVEIINRITGDALRGEFVATSLNRSRRVIVEKRFRSFDSMILWLTSINSLHLVNVKSLEPGEYYIKVTVESIIKKLPPVIGYLLFFVPEKEFSISKDSEIFRVGGR